MTFDKGESKFEKKMFVCVCVEGRGGGHTDTKTVCRTVSVEVKYRNTQCRACGNLNISKSKNSYFELSTKLRSLILKLGFSRLLLSKSN